LPFERSIFIKQREALPMAARQQYSWQDGYYFVLFLTGTITRRKPSVRFDVTLFIVFSSFFSCGRKEAQLMRMLLVILSTLVLSGCINITSELQPSDPDVKDVLMGEDCTPIVLGLGLGKNRIEYAMKDGRPYGDIAEFRSRVNLNRRTTITRIRTIQLTEFYVLLLGSRCVQVIGEP
jgi:hypothetical protein